jgi:hypothetical protein
MQKERKVESEDIVDNDKKKKKREKSFIRELNELESQLTLFLTNPFLYGIEDVAEVSDYQERVKEILREYYWGKEKRNLIDPLVKNYYLLVMSISAAIMYCLVENKSADEVAVLVVIAMIFSSLFIFLGGTFQKVDGKVNDMYKDAMNQGVKAQQLITEVEGFIKERSFSQRVRNLSDENNQEVTGETAQPKKVEVSKK